ncbi:MAG TPA: ATP-binding protein [Thermoanaerobaculia bacterium]|nr:ATP-binding protein [Thermoanaerobaculia bacterium]
MVFGAPDGLTKVSFRRDVRLFLAILVGLLVFMIAALIIGFGRNTSFGSQQTLRQWNTSADAAADTLRNSITSTSPDVLQAHLGYIRSRYAIDAAVIEMESGAIQSGVTTSLVPIERPLPDARLICYFDPSPIQNARRTFLLLAVICIIVAVAGMTLLALYVPKITRPIEQMLDQAGRVGEREAGQEDTQYVVETFRRTVSVLKVQEDELRRLHALQKTRADDLERISRALTRSILSGFLSLDRDGRVLEVNAAAREMIPLPPNVHRLTITEALGEHEFSRLIVEAFQQRRALTRAEAEISIGDAKHLIGLTTVPLTNDAGEFLGMLALFTDLTQIRELEGRVREMKNFADLGEIAAGIAHEFRNSLATILGYLRLSKRAVATTDHVASVEKAEREAASLAEAVDSLLSFARPMEFHTHPVDLLELAESIAERLRISTGVDIRCRGGNAVVLGDRTLLDRAIENVIRNAADSVHRKSDGGSVDVQVIESPRPRIVVTDDGVGVDPAEVPSLFLPFRSGNPNGHGLGLPLAKKIILLHGGNIRLTGEPGRGAMATVEFSATAVSEAQTARPA